MDKEGGIMSKWLLVMVLSLLSVAACDQAPAQAPEQACGNGRTMRLDTFMQREFPIDVPLKVYVPEEYEHVRVKGQRATYSYWMRPGAEKQAEETNHLPTETGYLYGKMSTSVGYDIPSDTFIGMKDVEAEAKAMGLSKIEVEKAKSHGHTLLFLQGFHEETQHWLYSVYIAMNVDTVVFFVSYTAPNNDPVMGDCVWGKVKSALKAP